VIIIALLGFWAFGGSGTTPTPITERPDPTAITITSAAGVAESSTLTRITTVQTDQTATVRVEATIQAIETITVQGQQTATFEIIRQGPINATATARGEQTATFEAIRQAITNATATAQAEINARVINAATAQGERTATANAISQGAINVTATPQVEATAQAAQVTTGAAAATQVVSTALPTTNFSPTTTPAPAETPTETSAPEPTAVINTYRRPVLISPAIETVIPINEEVILKWNSVGNLTGSERYAVRLVFLQNNQVSYSGDQTSATEWAIPLSFLEQVDGPERKFEWFVFVERTGNIQVSPESEHRLFYWGRD
jgi:hypothetical protein